MKATIFLHHKKVVYIFKIYYISLLLTVLLKLQVSDLATKYGLA